MNYDFYELLTTKTWLLIVLNLVRYCMWPFLSQNVVNFRNYLNVNDLDISPGMSPKVDSGFSVIVGLCIACWYFASCINWGWGRQERYYSRRIFVPGADALLVKRMHENAGPYGDFCCHEIAWTSNFHSTSLSFGSVPFATPQTCYYPARKVVWKVWKWTFGQIPWLYTLYSTLSKTHFSIGPSL